MCIHRVLFIIYIYIYLYTFNDEYVEKWRESMVGCSERRKPAAKQTRIERFMK